MSDGMTALQAMMIQFQLLAIGAQLFAIAGLLAVLIFLMVRAKRDR